MRALLTISLLSFVVGHGCAATHGQTPPPRREPPARDAPAPEPPAPPVARTPQSAERLSLERIAELVAQPDEAHSSGQRTVGSVADAAFLPPDGRYLVAGGNDDRAWIVELETNRVRWKSRRLGADVERIAAGGERFAVQSYGGSVAIFEWVPRAQGRVIDRGEAQLGHGELLGMVAAGTHFAYATIDDGLLSFDTLLGQVSEVVRGVSYAFFTSQLSAHGWIVLPAPSPPRLYNLLQGKPYRPALSLQHDDGGLRQAHVVARDRIATEHCDEQLQCTVRLLDWQARPQVEHRFDASGGVWAADVPSELAVSNDARYFVWYRDGLPLALVETETGRRVELPPIPRTPSATVRVVFSPYSANTFAVTLTPSANQVSVYQVRP